MRPRRARPWLSPGSFGGHAGIDLFEFLLVDDQRGGEKVGVNGEWHKQRLYALAAAEAQEYFRRILNGRVGVNWEFVGAGTDLQRLPIRSQITVR